MVSDEQSCSCLLLGAGCRGKSRRMAPEQSLCMAQDPLCGRAVPGAGAGQPVAAEVLWFAQSNAKLTHLKQSFAVWWGSFGGRSGYVVCTSARHTAVANMCSSCTINPIWSSLRCSETTRADCASADSPLCSCS